MTQAGRQAGSKQRHVWLLAAPPVALVQLRLRANIEQVHSSALHAAQYIICKVNSLLLCTLPSPLTLPPLPMMLTPLLPQLQPLPLDMPATQYPCEVDDRSSRCLKMSNQCPQHY
jgi:hypothetical protein